MRGDGDHMDDYEILEVLLCAFIPRVDVRPIAKTMVDRFGTVSAALAAAPERLKEIEGIGDATAAYIRATHLLMQLAAGDAVRDRPVISNWAALLNSVKLALRHEKNEQARVLYLDRKNKLIADEIVGRGTVDHAPVYPREIARRALELSASAIIITSWSVHSPMETMRAGAASAGAARQAASRPNRIRYQPAALIP